MYDYIWHEELKVQPIQLQTTKNLYLYFDYEREYGNNMASITDDDVNKILELLDKYQVKTTFFTVGKILKFYPESIKRIVEKGHEIGSHSYDHNKLTNVSNNAVFNDFNEFNKVSTLSYEVKGFHSPNGSWNHQTVKNLSKFQYTYDVISKKKRKHVNYIQVRYMKNRFYRLFTLGDDYPLLNNNYNPNEIKNYFWELYKKIKEGDIRGIGFHPWVLFSDDNIFKGFELFLDDLSKESNLTIKPALYYLNELVDKQ